MNIYNLDSEIRFINEIGQTLNIDEKIKLQLSLQQINEGRQYDDIKFWGKIEGSQKDYYIAMGLNFKSKYEFPNKQFFWTTNDFVFKQLPAILEEYKQQVSTFRQPFTGNSNHVLIQVTGGEQADGQEEQQQKQEEQQEEQDSDQEEVKEPPKNFTELDRLSYLIRAIENDCQTVPVGSVKLTTDHELRYNDSFQGITKVILNQFQHFRAPQSEDKKQQMIKDDALFSFDFLDPINQDLPKGCWSIQQSDQNVTVRNLLWPGYLGYHKLNSNIFGGVYFGNGLQNSDLSFVLNKY